MADLKISQLSDGGASQATDEYVIARSGANYRIDGASVAAAATSVGTLTSLTVSGDLTVDTSTLKVDSTNNRVGIGTASPGRPLNVVASYTASTIVPALKIATVGGYNPGSGTAIEFGQDQGTYPTWVTGRIASPRTGDNWGGSLTFSTNDNSAEAALVERMRLDASGNLGLGVTPTNTSNYVKMQISGTSGGIVDLLAGSTRHLTMYCAAGSSTIGTVSNTPLVFQTNDATRMTLDASGNLGVGETSPSKRLHVKKAAGAGTVATFTDGTYGVDIATTTTGGSIQAYDTNQPLEFNAYGTGTLLFKTASTERARIDASGNLGVGTTSPGAILDIRKSNSGGVGPTLSLINSASTANGNAVDINMAGNPGGGALSPTGRIRLSEDASANATLSFWTYSASGGTLTERARITSGGILGVGVTNPTGSTADAEGMQITPTYILANRSAGAGIGVNRKTNDGDLVVFYQADDIEGTISVSGNTVSYNAFAGSHWSQLEDGSKPEILRGTVMEALNELCEWPDETNERLPKAKVSDTAGSKKVYGVFMDWDNDWTVTNDMYVTAVGAFICRVNGSVTVQEGDLLESNGDGTARVQADDVIRSSTIGKVTSTVKTHEYEDGTYCVPTVLYCG